MREIKMETKEMRKKYFDSLEEMDKEIKKRTKGIASKAERKFAKNHLSDAFQDIMFYESAFRGFNKMVGETVSLQSRVFCLYPVKDPVSHFLGYLSWNSYEKNLALAKSCEADISGLPEKLNYLEHLN